MKTKKTKKSQMFLEATSLNGFTPVGINSPSDIIFKPNSGNTSLDVYNGSSFVTTIPYKDKSNGLVCYFVEKTFYFKTATLEKTKTYLMVAGCYKGGYKALAQGSGTSSGFIIKGEDDNRDNNTATKPCVLRSVKATFSQPAFVFYFPYNFSNILYDAICLAN